MDIAGDGAVDGKPFPPCAACQHQRYRCGPACILAPYFPAGLEADFARVDKLFGARNVAYKINTLSPDLRRAAAESLVHEARALVDCPPGGYLRVARALIFELLRCQSELRYVNKQLQYLRAMKAAAMPLKEFQEPVSLQAVGLEAEASSSFSCSLEAPESSSSSLSSLQMAIRQLHDQIAQEEEEEDEEEITPQLQTN